MGSKSLMAEPLWAARYRIKLAWFNVTPAEPEEKPIPHHQGFDVRISNITSFQIRFAGSRQRVYIVAEKRTTYFFSTSLPSL
jgi:hypothetical protein